MIKREKFKYVDIIADNTLLGLKRIGKNNYEVFVEYIEPNRPSMIDPICNLPEESFEINDDAIAVFCNKDGNVELKDVYDIEYHKFVVKDKVSKTYKEKFSGHYKTKEKVG